MGGVTNCRGGQKRRRADKQVEKASRGAWAYKQGDSVHSGRSQGARKLAVAERSKVASENDTLLREIAGARLATETAKTGLERAHEEIVERNEQERIVF